MRNTNYPAAMTYAQMEHALYMRKMERKADKLVKALQMLFVSVTFGVAIGIAALITAML